MLKVTHTTQIVRMMNWFKKDLVQMYVKIMRLKHYNTILPKMIIIYHSSLIIIVPLVGCSMMQRENLL